MEGIKWEEMRDQKKSWGAGWEDLGRGRNTGNFTGRLTILTFQQISEILVLDKVSFSMKPNINNPEMFFNVNKIIGLFYYMTAKSWAWDNLKSFSI